MAQEKTTFFNCLNRDIAADEGQFFLEDAAGGRRSAQKILGMC